jgi:UDP-N-acetylmuramate dehydrogenase
MINEELKNGLAELTKGELLFDEPLSNHSTIKAGGPADIYVAPLDNEELIALVKFAKDNQINIFFLGAGSNVLFRDSGFDGLVISSANLTNYNVKSKDAGGIVLEADAGVSVNQLVNFALEEGVAGFEDLAGIPGTIGGAIFMNAGTHDGVVSDPLVKINAIDRSGKLYEWPKEKLELSYRKTKFPKACMVLSAEFILKTASKEEIDSKANELRLRRKERHPLSWPSLGSIFKNPRQGPSAGQLIEEAGLKGVRVGGARVANEHCNWIVNENNATAKDIEVLVHLIREKVKESADVVLDPEIIIVGRREN